MDFCNRSVWGNGDMEDCGKPTVLVLGSEREGKAGVKSPDRYCQEHAERELTRLQDFERKIRAVVKP